ncbi:hypothetical protein [Nannocystis punicea]|uniref:Knr4/Smi1-like domain-containing protein n=1 Tax=Nannocystis punicea TaxID=2995304 RepID=A0ABY7HDJ8_9BACT|nr:hypothetical protein [Nannocystis poenicansa]WAS97365.1 hypothetical protein O0S08_14555 [Nannocystis poenicansa]
MWLDELIRLLPRDLPVRGTSEPALRQLEDTLGRPLPLTYLQFARWAGDTPFPFLALGNHDLSVPAVLAGYEKTRFVSRPECVRIGHADSVDRLDLFLALDGDDPPIFLAEVHELPDEEYSLLARRFSEHVAFELFDREVLARRPYHLRAEPSVHADLGALDTGDDVDAFVREALSALGYVARPPNRDFFIMQRGDTDIIYHRLPASMTFVVFIGASDLAALDELRAGFPAPLTISAAPVRGAVKLNGTSGRG